MKAVYIVVTTSQAFAAGILRIKGSIERVHYSVSKQNWRLSKMVYLLET